MGLLIVASLSRQLAHFSRRLPSLAAEIFGVASCLLLHDDPVPTQHKMRNAAWARSSELI